MRKKLLCTALLLSTLLVGGCGFESDVVINDDETYNATSSVYYTGEEISSLGQMNNDVSEYEKVKKNGKTYYKADGDDEFGSWNDITKNGGVVTDDKVALCLYSDKSIPLNFDFIDFTVKVPFKIGYTNYELVDDNTIRVTNLDNNILIAKDVSVTSGDSIDFIVTNTDKELKDGEIFGLSDLWYVGTDENNSKSVEFTKIRVDSKDSFVDNASTTNSKIDIDFNPYAGTNLALNMSLKNATFGKKVTADVLAKDGKYTVNAELISGAKKSCIYYIDTKAPTVTVKNNKLTCVDKKRNGYASGIKSITVNGKSVKNGTSVKRGSKIVVKDNAGNVTKKIVK